MADDGLVERLLRRSRRYQIGSEWGHDLRAAAARITALEAQLAEAQGEWLPIETAPRDGTFVLIYSAWDESVRTGVWREAWGLPKLIPFADRSLNTTEGYWVEDRYDENDPIRYPYRPIHEATHWRPLPAPPAILSREVGK